MAVRGDVLGLGHDQLERDLLVAEVGRRGVAELMHPRSSFRARHCTAPGTRRPQVRTTLAAAALAGFGLADGAAAARRAGRNRPGRGPDRDRPYHPSRVERGHLPAVDGGANAIPLGLPTDRTELGAQAG